MNIRVSTARKIDWNCKRHLKICYRQFKTDLGESFKQTDSEKSKTLKKKKQSEPHTAMLTRNIQVQTLKKDKIAKTTYQ